MNDRTMKDLVVLVADLDAENAICAILARSKAMEIRPLSFDKIRHSGRDAGCRKDCVEFLRRYQGTHSHALVVFDLHGSGREAQDQRSLEEEIEKRLADSGWNDRAAVVVLTPELETWVWSDSPHVSRILGWASRSNLRGFLIDEGFLSEGDSKPGEPKEAVEGALRKAQKPRSARIYRELAENREPEVLSGCRVRQILQDTQGMVPEGVRINGQITMEAVA